MPTKMNAITDYFIENPEFTFVFTINLDGKINMLSILNDIKNEKEGRLEELLGENPGLTPLDNYFKTKERFFSKLLSNGCGKCKIEKQDKEIKEEEIKKCTMRYMDLTETNLSHFVNTDFINKAVLGHWKLSGEHKVEWKKGDEIIFEPILSNKNIRHRLRERVLNGYLDLKKNIISLPLTEQNIIFIVIDKKEIDNFVNFSKDFIKTDLLNENKEKSDKKEKFDILIEKYLKEKPNFIKPKSVTFNDLPDYIQLSKDIEIKLFSTGSISILIRFKFGNKPVTDEKTITNKNEDEKIIVNENTDEKILFEPHILVKLIQLPNLVVPQYQKHKPDDKKEVEKNKKGLATGFLNYIAYDIANDVFHTFFKCLERNEILEKDKAKSLVKYLEIERIDTEKKKEKIHKNRYTIFERYKRGIYTRGDNELIDKSHLNKNEDLIETLHQAKIIGKNIIIQDKNFDIYFDTNIRDAYALEERLEPCKLTKKDHDLVVSVWRKFRYIQSLPYVGVMFDRPHGLSFDDVITEEEDYKKFTKLLVGVATQTEEFIDYFKDPVEYLKQNSLTRGSQDAIIVERRGFVASGIRHISELGSSPELDREHFLENPFNTLVFSIETIMATVKSVSAFNKELEEFISPAMNNMLHNETNVNYDEIKRLHFLVSKARALSPCEDFSSNLVPNLRSKIAMDGSIKIQEFSLNKLIDTVHKRLENYGHFLKTAHEELIIKKNNLIAELMALLSFSMIYIMIVDFCGRNIKSPTDFMENEFLAHLAIMSPVILAIIIIIKKTSLNWLEIKELFKRE